MIASLCLVVTTPIMASHLRGFIARKVECNNMENGFGKIVAVFTLGR